MKTIEDIKVDTNFSYIIEVSLSKLLDKPIKDIHGYFVEEYGSYSFKINKIIFEDLTSLYVEGNNDMAYINSNDKFENFSENDLERLHKECYGDEEYEGDDY